MLLLINGISFKDYSDFNMVCYLKDDVLVYWEFLGFRTRLPNTEFSSHMGYWAFEIWLLCTPLLINAVTQMNLRNMLSESQYKRPHVIWFCLYEISRKGKLIYGDRVDYWLPRAGGEREWGVMTANK